MVKFLAIGNIWHRSSEFSGQDLTKAPCVVKHMKIDEEFVMGRMDYCLLNGGLAYGLYNVNQIPLTSDPMLVALLSDPKIWIPLSLI